MSQKGKLFGITGLLVAGLLFISADSAKAQYYGNFGNTGYQPSYSQNYGGFSGNYSGPVYHQPSVHYHKTYHPTQLHWTPSGGLHTHGHYHVTPHVTPGHFDFQHGNHLHTNPFYHNH